MFEPFPLGLSGGRRSDRHGVIERHPTLALSRSFLDPRISRRTGLSRNTVLKYLRSDSVEPKFTIPDSPRQGPDNRRATKIVSQAVHELLRGLELADTKGEQKFKGGIAGTEVVDRNSKPSAHSPLAPPSLCRQGRFVWPSRPVRGGASYRGSLVMTRSRPVRMTGSTAAWL